MTQPMVLAITLNWRQAETTLACVRALQAMAYPNLRILVIDNGSEDGSAARLAAELPPEARLLALPENLGFAAGNNVGLREAIAQAFDFALLVNNDAFAAPDMLARLLAETAPDVGLVSPKIFMRRRGNASGLATAVCTPSPWICAARGAARWTARIGSTAATRIMCWEPVCW